MIRNIIAIVIALALYDAGKAFIEKAAWYAWPAYCGLPFDNFCLFLRWLGG